MLRTLLTDTLSLFFPQACLACQEPLAGGERHLCTACRVELPYTHYHQLPPDENPLGRRFWGRLPTRHVLSYLHFLRHGRTQLLLHQLKYRGQRHVGHALGGLYGAELAGAGLAGTFAAVVPVPLHPRKLARRGYNQAEAFGAGLAEQLGCPSHGESLRRLVHTDSQTRKSRAERWHNVATVFEVAQPEKITGRHVLLVDDVLTTGATLEACGKALLAAGAEAISIATVASA